MPGYPFAPKSTTHLQPGQFWSFPLRNKRFAAGYVISKLVRSGKIESRIFLAGLLDWSGRAYPTAEELSGVRIIESGAAHINAITENGGHILGAAAINGIRDKPIAKTEGIIKVLAEKHFGTVSQQPLKPAR